ncbi:nickel/cobalt transporter [Oceanispirochaeta crateris]|uniref:nickel/cobalt transporter n=1 Tax=Oceanispirochaeta crateris TaxID=2518645 RepID=UPI00143D04A9|nr:hypothetical protein [Oceanispirochaeta crateris]
MFIDFRRDKRSVLIFLMMIAGLYAQANPFLGNNEGKKTPSVRPPGHAGFLIEQQLEFRDRIGNMLLESQEKNDSALLIGILGLAFLYGILHSAGPGHRKTVIFSVFLSRKAKWYEPLAAAMMSAGAHASAAVFLVLFFQYVFQKMASVQINNISQYMEGISFILLFVLSLYFSIKVVIRLIKKEAHHHGPKEKDKNLYSTLLISSFFPCPGVIMILSFSIALGLLKLGILSIIALSLGMGLTISLVAYLAYFGRTGLFNVFKKKEKRLESISAYLELSSFLFLSLFSLWMAFPFILAFLR